VFSELEELLPGSRPARQDDIAVRGIFPDEHFRSFEPEVRRQTNSLATPI
jgi:hypothetical protein